MSLFEDKKLAEATEFLTKKDKKLARVIQEAGTLEPSTPEAPFEAFCKIVVNQQLSGAAADTILGRIRALPELQQGLHPENFVNLDHDNLTGCGVSRNKADFMMGFAERLCSNDDLVKVLSSSNDEDALKSLLKVRGVGVWSAAIYLMSCFGRMNVYPHGDVTLNRAISISHGFPAATEASRTAALVETWSPYRSVAARYLWKWYDTKDLTEAS